MARRETSTTEVSTTETLIAENIVEEKTEYVKNVKGVVEVEKIKGTIIYCGPTIKGVVKQYASFTNGVPKKVQEYANSNKAVSRLLVPISEFIETKKNIVIKGTVENSSFNSILDKRGE